MFKFRPNSNSLDNECLQVALAALSFNLFTATYNELTAFKTENRIEAVNREASGLAAASEEMSASIQELTGSFETVTGNQRTVEQQIAEGRRTLQAAVSSLDEAGQYITNLAAVVEQLGKRVSEITSAVEIITSIAEQTNLLALNAAIEAARAGEQGRGFSVVAEEVKKLADMSAASAKEIKIYAQELGRGMSETMENMLKAQNSVQSGITKVQEASVPFDEIQSNTAELTRVMEEQTATVQEQSAVSQEVAANATAITAATDFASEVDREAFEHSRVMRRVFDRYWPVLEKGKDRAGLVSFLAQRVVDHSRWIDKVVAVLRNETKAAELPDHHNCALGKWYYGEGKETVQQYSTAVRDLFGRLEEPHRLVHQYGLDAVRCHQKGDNNGAFMEAMKLTGASVEIINTLMLLIEAVRKESRQ